MSFRFPRAQIELAIYKNPVPGVKTGRRGRGSVSGNHVIRLVVNEASYTFWRSDNVQEHSYA